MAPSTTPSCHQLGQRLSYDGALCTVRFVGEVAGTDGAWLGVEWDDASRGKHNGCHRGVRYFACLSRSPTAASFVRPTRPSDDAQDFLSAVYGKYGSGVATPSAAKETKAVVISGKVAEEVGFDKVRRQLARLNELRVVILDGERINAATTRKNARTIRETCPRITDLDLGRNLISDFNVVADICAQLDELQSLKLDGNRFHHVLGAEADAATDVPRESATQQAFGRVRDLGLGAMLLSWEEICHLTSRFGALQSLSCGANQLSILSLVPPPALCATLASLGLEHNEFAALSDLVSLTRLTSLCNLHLKGNCIRDVTRDASASAPVFGPALRYLDISYNNVECWSFVDALPDSFPGLVSLRLAHNPVYEDAALDQGSGAGSGGAGGNDDSFMTTVARLGGLRTLNFSAITPAERLNAEIFYLFSIGRELSQVPEGSEAAVLRRHRRYSELCGIHGAPVISRDRGVGQGLLEGRLIVVLFHLHLTAANETRAGASGIWLGGVREYGVPVTTRRAEIPRSRDMYAVKGIAGRLFGISPLRLRLMWETGDWDLDSGLDAALPSADGSSGVKDVSGRHTTAGVATSAGERRHGRRLVELTDGPRQFGYCVDGPKAIVHVEMIPYRRDQPA